MCSARGSKKGSPLACRLSHRLTSRNSKSAYSSIVKLKLCLLCGDLSLKKLFGLLSAGALNGLGEMFLQVV